MIFEEPLRVKEEEDDKARTQPQQCDPTTACRLGAKLVAWPLCVRAPSPCSECEM